MKSIYFTVGPVATEGELQEADDIINNGAEDDVVVIRNALYAGSVDSIELCDAAFGNVPQIYIDYLRNKKRGGSGGFAPDNPAYAYNMVLMPSGPDTYDWSLNTAYDTEVTVNKDNTMLGLHPVGYKYYATYNSFITSKDNDQRPDNPTITDTSVLIDVTEEMSITLYRTLQVFEYLGREFEETDPGVTQSLNIVIYSLEGPTIARYFDHSFISFDDLIDYLDNVQNGNHFDNPYYDDAIKTITLPVGSYRMEINAGFNNITPLNFNAIVQIAKNSGEGSHRTVSEVKISPSLLYRFPQE